MLRFIIEYLFHGHHKVEVEADTLAAAIDRFRHEHPEIPGIAFLSVISIPQSEERMKELAGGK